MTDSEQSEPSRPRATVLRRATAEDLPAIGRLLRVRDGHEWDAASLRWFFCGLDPSRCVAWIADSGDGAVGLTSLYIRRLRVGDRELRAGYWANLFIHPEHRGQMLYPRLPLAMTRSMRELGIDLIYAAIRQLDVAKAHRSIGFASAGTMPVLFKPLRPGRLLAKTRSLGPSARALARPLDRAFQAALAWRWRRHRDRAIDVRIEGEDGAKLAELLDRAGKGRAAQPWDVDGLRDRFSQTREGGRYVSFGSRDAGRLNAAVIGRMAVRGEGIGAGVVMEALTSSGDAREVLAPLTEIERAFHRDGADVMLYLDGLGEATGNVLRSFGYRTSPEVYDLSVFPKTLLAEYPPLQRTDGWRISFADHDAF